MRTVQYVADPHAEDGERRDKTRTWGTKMVISATMYEKQIAIARLVSRTIGRQAMGNGCQNSRHPSGRVSRRQKTAYGPARFGVSLVLSFSAWPGGRRFGYRVSGPSTRWKRKSPRCVPARR